MNGGAKKGASSIQELSGDTWCRQEEPEGSEKEDHIRTRADAVLDIQKGKVQLTVESKSGKDATIGLLNQGILLATVRWLRSLSAWDLQLR